MSETKIEIEELERPAEELSGEAAAAVTGGGWTLTCTPASPDPSESSSLSTKQTRQSSVVVDL